MVVCHTAPCTTYTTILSNQEQASTTDHDVCRRIRCLYMFANSENTRRGCVLCQEHCFFAFKGLGFLDKYTEYAHNKPPFPAKIAGVLDKKGLRAACFSLRKRRQIQSWISIKKRRQQRVDLPRIRIITTTNDQIYTCVCIFVPFVAAAYSACLCGHTY